MCSRPDDSSRARLLSMPSPRMAQEIGSRSAPIPQRIRRLWPRQLPQMYFRVALRPLQLTYVGPVSTCMSDRLVVLGVAGFNQQPEINQFSVVWRNGVCPIWGRFTVSPLRKVFLVVSKVFYLSQRLQCLLRDWQWDRQVWNHCSLDVDTANSIILHIARIHET